MITVHEVVVDGYNISPKVLEVGTKGSYGNEYIQLKPQSGWDGLIVNVTFRPPNKPPVVLLYNGEPLLVPHEVTSIGGKTEFMVSGRTQERVIKSVIGTLNVMNTLNIATTPPQSPTPSEMEQVYDWLQEAVNIANSVRSDADNGVFDGEDGVTPVFSVGQVEKGDEPELTITGTVLNPVLNFTLPKGDKGGTGATGETGATFIPDVSENGIISWNNDRDLPNPQSRDITGPIGPAGVAIGVPPDNDPLKRVWVNPDGEALINEVIDNLIEESTIARDESVEAKGITLEAKDEAIAAQGKAEQAERTAKSHAEQTGEDRIATGEDRVATGADRSAVNTSLLGFAETTLPDAIQAVEDKADTEIARVGQASDTQVQAVNAAGAEQIGLATEQADRAEGEADRSETEADKSEQSATIAANNILNGVNTHNDNPAAHESIRDSVDTVEAIARGKANSKVFATREDMYEWLEDSENTDMLNVGDNLYIIDLGVPDYWWDGESAQELEAEAPRLVDYYTKLQVQMLLPLIISREDYDMLVSTGQVEAGRLYDIIEEDEET